MDKTLVKGLRLLETLAASTEPRGVTSLAKELSLTKSNAHRLLFTLASNGYVRRLDSGSYEVCVKLWELGALVRSRIDLTKVARPHMSILAQKTGESVHLSILDGLETVYLDKIESKQPIAAYSRIGGRNPAWCVATGKAMLAYTGSNIGALTPHFKKFTANTIYRPAAVKREFERIRAKGFAVNDGEWHEGVYGIAAPIWESADKIAGAVGIAGPNSRFKKLQIRVWSDHVIEAASAISRSLGFQKQPCNK
jgi:DNA-binding IclR family transcriptional regulator